MTTPVIKKKQRTGGGVLPGVPDDLLVTIDIADPDYPEYELVPAVILTKEDVEYLYGRTK